MSTKCVPLVCVGEVAVSSETAPEGIRDRTVVHDLSYASQVQYVQYTVFWIVHYMGLTPGLIKSTR